MLEILLAPEALPFSIALSITAGLFLVEIISLILGATVLGIGSDGPNLDLDGDFDLSADLDLDAGDFGIDNPVDGLDGPAAPSGLLGWLGLRDVPFLIWLVSFLTMFGLAGLIIQTIAQNLIGSPIYTSLAVLLAGGISSGITRVIANHVALIMPKTETSAMPARYLGGHSGTITQGTAARGRPAEAKIKDRFGNMHYLRVEPLDDEAVFPQGSDVTVISKQGGQFFVI